MKSIRKKAICLSKEIEKLWSEKKVGEIIRINKIRAHFLDCYGMEKSKMQVKDAMYIFMRKINLSNSGKYKYLAIPWSPEKDFEGLEKLPNDEAGRKAWEEYRNKRMKRKVKELNMDVKYLNASIDKGFMTENKADKMIVTNESELYQNIKALQKGSSHEPKERESLASTRLGDLVLPEEEKSEATPKEAL